MFEKVIDQQNKVSQIWFYRNWWYTSEDKNANKIKL